MKWFDERKKQMVGSDVETPAASYQEIAEIADAILGGQEMVRFVEDEFFLQKRFAEFLGVGESTVAGWMKSGSFPNYAKRAAVAAYYVRQHFFKLDDAKHDAARSKVVKDGEGYSIVQFEIDKAGVAIGEVLARGIPTKQAALKFASSDRAWDLLSDAELHIEDEIASRGEHVPSDHLEELKAKIDLEWSRVFAHDKLLESKRKELESERNLREEIESLDLLSDADDPAEEGENADV